MVFRSAIVCVFLATAPAAQGQNLEGDSFEEGLDLFSEGARRLMQELAGELGPLLMQLEMLMDEMTAYQAPEILENGDIIIRRRPDAPVPAPQSPGGDGDTSIDL